MHCLCPLTAQGLPAHPLVTLTSQSILRDKQCTWQAPCKILSMSTSASNSLHSSTRNLRAPPNVSRANSIAASPLSRGTSNISLFLTNLRLLDLDLREDWPEIDALTFSTKDSQHNYKKRIHCVEWALYQLFVIWDPLEARNKLQPFYPPLEPLQSLNLRNALFRCLEQIKKNGTLSQDTVLRKTMFDECKGERLEEILAVFSNVVLKRVVQQRSQNYHKPLAQQLALQNFSYKGERTILSSMIIVHRASLTKHLREKEEARTRYRDFSNLLSLAEWKIARQHEQLNQVADENSSQGRFLDKQTKEIQDRVLANWTEDADWVKEILYGRNSNENQHLLSLEFNDIWSHVEKGTIGEVEDKSKLCLLDQLDNRIQDQESRLARWQEFGKSLGTKTTAIPNMKTHAVSNEQTKTNLDFTKHQFLQVGCQNLEASLPESFRSFNDYSQLIEKMKLDLIKVRKPHVQTIKTSTPSRVVEECIPIRSRPTKLSEKEPRKIEDEWDSSINSESETGSSDIADHSPSRFRVDRSRVSGDQERKRVEYKEESSKKNVDSLEDCSREPLQIQETITRSSYPTFKLKNSEPEIVAEMEAESDLDLANQILDMVSSSSPSPRKIPAALSLAERTRLSMARTSRSRHSDVQESNALKSSSSSNKSRSSTVLKTSSVDLGTEGFADLTERTRMSMVGIEAAQKKAQLERQRSLKAARRQQRESSYFAKEDEVTVPDTSAIELMEGDPDYESVFKSRPKVKTSPTMCSEKVREYQEIINDNASKKLFQEERE